MTSVDYNAMLHSERALAAFGGDKRRATHTLLSDPPYASVQIPVVSVDDHFVEPGDLFLRHMASEWGDDIPRIVRKGGLEYWRFEDLLEAYQTAPMSIVGRPPAEWTLEPLLFEDMRPGSYDPFDRLCDMDRAGVAASLCFPSAFFGFAGQRFYRMKDPSLGLAAMRAYNDWIIEEWVATNPDRFIAQQVTWLPDPVIAATEVYRNADRGFRAVAFSENPEALGFPSVYSSHWDPFFEACRESETVVNLHIGSSSRTLLPSADSPPDAQLALFPLNAMLASVDWVYARVPVRYPGLRIVLSESGVSWIPMILERLRRNSRMINATTSWPDPSMTPEEVFRAGFCFTSIEDPSGISQRHEIGVDRIMLEVDYPHPDTSWPNTQTVVAGEIGHLPADERDQIAFGNACRIYRHSSAAVDLIRSASEGPVGL